MTKILKPAALPLTRKKTKKPIDYKIETYGLFSTKKPMLLTDPPQLADGVTILVESITKMCGDWEGTKQFEGTPARLARMYSELCWSPEKIKHELDSQFHTFPNSYNEMLVGGPIKVYTLCPHHLLPCLMRVWIGYVPNGEVIGLSKLVRVPVILGHRPTMQEQFGTDLIKEIDDRLHPKGIGVLIIGTHGCMSSRGVMQEVPIRTTNLQGCLNESAPRAEFLSAVEARQ